MSWLRCIGRTDSLGDLHEYGSHVGFVYRLPGCANHTITLDEKEASRLYFELEKALWPDGRAKD